MRAVGEISELKAEKERILNGTQVKIDKIEEHINDLEQLKDQCHAINFIKKMKLNSEIKGYETKKADIIRRKK